MAECGRARKDHRKTIVECGPSFICGIIEYGLI